MFKPKAQASTEYFLVVAIALLLLSPIFVKGVAKLQEVQTNQNLVLVDTALSNIADVAKLVYAQKPPSRFTLQVKLPKNIKEAKVENNYIAIVMPSATGRNTTFVRSFDFNVTGNLPTQEGLHNIRVEAIYVNGSTWVNITEVR